MGRIEAEPELQQGKGEPPNLPLLNPQSLSHRCKRPFTQSADLMAHSQGERGPLA